jgi:hypothetical protein
LDKQRGYFYVEIVDLNSHLKVGYVPSKLASQMENDDWTLRKVENGEEMAHGKASQSTSPSYPISAPSPSPRSTLFLS